MAVIGCDIPCRVSGAESIADKTGIWVKTHFRQDGNYLVATTYLVAAGEPTVFEMRIDLRPLELVAQKVHEALHAKMAAASGTPEVGFSFAKAFKSIKNTAKKIGKSKLVKAVTGTISAVVKNKAFQIAMPVAALSAHTLSKAAGGKGVLPGALGKVADLGTSIALQSVPGGALASATPKALAAFGSAQAALAAVNKGRQLAHTVSTAQGILAKGNAIAKTAVTVKAQGTAAAKAAVAQGTAAANAKAKQIATAVKKAESQAKAAPVVKKAVELKKKLADPAVQKKLLAIKAQAASAQKVLGQVAFDSTNATGAKKVDAQKSRAIVNLVALNDAKMKALAQRTAGGLPALLIDKKGKITRGRYSIKASSAAKGADLLYLGPGQKTEKGVFTKIGDGVSRVANDIIGGASATVAGCFAVQNKAPKRNLRIGSIAATAPGLIGCDCGSEF